MVLWVVMPCSLEKAQHFRGKYHLQFQDWRVSKQKNHRGVGGKQSSEMSGFFQTMQWYNPKDRTHRTHHCEDLKSNKDYTYFPGKSWNQTNQYGQKFALK
jgi:hypothetical protein